MNILKGATWSDLGHHVLEGAPRASGIILGMAPDMMSSWRAVYKW